MRNLSNLLKKLQTWLDKKSWYWLSRPNFRGDVVWSWVLDKRVQSKSLPWPKWCTVLHLEQGLLAREGNPFREFLVLHHVKIWNYFSNSSLVPLCLILSKIPWGLPQSATWDSLHWKCLAVKRCKTCNNVNTWYFNFWLFRAFKLLPNEIWHLLVWWGWEMTIFKQLCLYFAEWFSVVIYLHCGFLVITSPIKPFYTSVSKTPGLCITSSDISAHVTILSRGSSFQQQTGKDEELQLQLRIPISSFIL